MPRERGEPVTVCCVKNAIGSVVPPMIIIISPEELSRSLHLTRISRICWGWERLAVEEGYPWLRSGDQLLLDFF